VDLSLYFICDSPIFKLSGGLLHHIYRRGKPRFLAALFILDPYKESALNYDGLNLPFRYVRGDGQEHLFVLIIRDIIDRTTTTKLNQFLQEAAHYYVSCLSAQDQKKYEKKSSWAYLSQYNDFMPEVTLLELSAASSFVLFYPAGISTFKSIEDASEYLIKELHYNEGLMEEACVNVLAPQKPKD
jgi:hypothetical protein